jgi:polysaccharide export outer membrane protein
MVDINIDQRGVGERLTLYCRRLLLVFSLICFSTTDRPAAAAEPQSASVSPPQPARTYKLQSGDTISVFYRLTPEYNQSLTILPDGYVDLRLTGPVHVEGLDVEQAQQAIVAEAGKRLRNPEVSLSVIEFVRDQFTVMGEVGKPGKYEIRGPTSIVDALALASGFTSASAQRRVILVRPIAANSAYGNATIFDFKKLSHLDATTALPVVKSGDIIIVTTSKFAKVSGIIKLINVGLYYSPLPSV